MRAVVVAILLVLSATVASAQTPVASVSSSLAFSVSPDHAVQVGGVNLVDRYQLDVFLQGSQAPAFSRDLGKPTVDASNTATVPIGWTATQFAALASGTYTVIVSAVGQGGSTASTPSDPFLRIAAPRAAGKPSLK